jgi:putative insertion element HTH domain-containing protein
MVAEHEEIEELDAQGKASFLLARDELTDAQIAQIAGIGTTTLYRWKKDPDFLARIDQHNSDFRELARRKAITIVERRIDALNDRAKRIKRLINERAEARIMQGVPGGTTGLLSHTLKSIGSGENATTVDEYTFDVAVLKELREIEKQAAIELGQWERRVTIEGAEPAKRIVIPDADERSI